MFVMFAFKIIKTLSVNEEKLTDLWARNCALTIQQVLILKFAFGPERCPCLSRNGPQQRKTKDCSDIN